MDNFEKYQGHIREALAEFAHDDFWAHWMKYMISCCSLNKDGSLTIPAEKVERWIRQANTKFYNLPESEKKSDYEQAQKIIETIRNTILSKQENKP